MLKSVKESVHRMTNHLQLISGYLEMEDYTNPDNSRKLDTKSLFHGKKPLLTRLWYQEEAFV